MTKSRLTNSIYYILLALLLFPAIQPLLAGDFTCGYDNTFHLWRAVETEHLLRQGVLFSRWSPDMAHGYGYPLSNFAAPASACAVALLRLIGLPWAWALNLTFILGWALSVYAMYLLASDLFDRYAGLAAAVLYGYVPFHAYDVFYRGGLSQSVAWFLPPLILWALRRTDRRAGFAVAALGAAGLILTHNAFALLFAPILVAYLPLAGYERNKKTLVWGGLALLVGLGLSAFFWLPALVELGFVHSERLGGGWVFDYANNFLPLSQLFALPRNADPSLINDWPARGLGLVPALLALAGLLAWRDRARRPTVAFFAFILVGCLFLILPVSQPVWDAIPLLQRVQFPWRLVGPAALCAAILTGAAVSRLSLAVSRLLPARPHLSDLVPAAAVLLVILPHLGWFYPDHCSPPTDTSIAGMIAWERATDTLGTTAKGEYLPGWVHQMPQDPALDAAYAAGESVVRLSPESLPEGAHVIRAEYGPLDAVIELESRVPFQARYLAFYYPGWRVTVDGALIPITPTDPDGLISFDVPPGRHIIRVRFGETLLRLVADIISFLSLIALLSIILLPRITLHVLRFTHHISRFTFCVTLITALFLVALALNLSPYLRGPDDWRWAYAIPGRPDHLWLPALALVLYLILAFVWVRQVTKREDSHTWRRRVLLLALVVAVPIIQASLMNVDCLRSLFYRTVSAGSSGVFSVGSAIEDAGDFLRRYPALMPALPVHPQRYPPGLSLLFYLARRLLEKMPALADALGFYLRRYQCHDLSLMRLSNATIGSAAIQMALPLLSGLVLLPLYGLARRVYGQRIAAWVVALYPLVSSFSLWAGRWEQFYPLLACTAWYFFHIGLTESRRSALLAAGFTLSIASLLNFSVLALLLPLGLFALFWLIAHPDRYRRHWRRLIADALLFCLGLASLWIIYQLAFGVGLLDIWRVSMSYHLGLNRSYWTWLFYHLYDFFVFLGIPLALLFVVASIKAVRDLFRFAKRHTPSAIDPLTLGFASGLLLLDLSGVARGEVARVWIFLTPFAALIAARGLARLRLGRRGFFLVACLLALQLFTFNTFLRVVTTGLDDPPSRAHIFAPPPIAHPLDARFSADGADAIALLGYDLEPESPAPGDTLRLTLYWQALRPLTRPYNVFTHLLNLEGQLVGQQDNMPLRDTAPTTCWLPGEIIADPYDIPIDPQTLPGDHVLATGFYFWMTGERLPVSGSAAATDDRILLPPISIGAR